MMNKLCAIFVLILFGVGAYAETDAVNKKVNEKYTNNPKMHQKIENTRGNSDGYYEHPNTQQHEPVTNPEKTQVTSDTANKVQSNIQNTTPH